MSTVITEFTDEPTPVVDSLPQLPTCAGSVMLEYDPLITVAKREGPNSIVLPLHDDEKSMKFYPLRGGTQYLARYYESCFRRSHVMFFGADETAFISGVTDTAWKAFVADGEKGFFDSLMPTQVKSFQSALPHAPITRQGDIFIGRIPWDWQTVAGEHIVHKTRRERASIRDRAPTTDNVLNTRHVVTGKIVQHVTLVVGGTEIPRVTVATGQMTAPDHLTRHLGDQPHMLARAANIAQPTDEQLIAGWEN